MKLLPKRAQSLQERAREYERRFKQQQREEDLKRREARHIMPHVDSRGMFGFTMRYDGKE